MSAAAPATLRCMTCRRDFTPPAPLQGLAVARPTCADCARFAAMVPELVAIGAIRLELHTEQRMAELRGYLNAREAPRLVPPPDQVPSAELLELALYRNRLAAMRRRNPATAKREALAWLKRLRRE